MLVGLASWSAVALLLGLGLLGWPSRAALVGWLGIVLGAGLAMLAWWWVLGRLLARLSRAPESAATTLKTVGMGGMRRQWSSAGARRLAAWTFAPLAAGWLVALIALTSPELHHNLIHSTTIQRRFIFLLAAPTLLAQVFVLLRAYSGGSTGNGVAAGSRWDWWPVVVGDCLDWVPSSRTWPPATCGHRTLPSTWSTRSICATGGSPGTCCPGGAPRHFSASDCLRWPTNLP